MCEGEREEEREREREREGREERGREGELEGGIIEKKKESGRKEVLGAKVKLIDLHSVPDSHKRMQLHVLTLC